MLYCALAGPWGFAPKVHAHLSPFSEPLLSAQPEVGFGSVLVSSSSWAITDTMPSTPALPLGPVVCAAQALRQREALPTNEYLIFVDEIGPEVCQPQYLLQKPDRSATSEDVSTKYKPSGLGNPNFPLAIAWLTTAWTADSQKREPWDELSTYSEPLILT